MVLLFAVRTLTMGVQQLVVGVTAWPYAGVVLPPDVEPVQHHAGSPAGDREPTNRQHDEMFALLQAGGSASER